MINKIVERSFFLCIRYPTASRSAPKSRLRTPCSRKRFGILFSSSKDTCGSRSPKATATNCLVCVGRERARAMSKPEGLATLCSFQIRQEADCRNNNSISKPHARKVSFANLDVIYERTAQTAPKIHAAAIPHVVNTSGLPEAREAATE